MSQPKSSKSSLKSANGPKEISAGTDFDTNLYSRQLYTFGETAMRRLRSAKILVSGMGGVGVEIAKNLILGGIRHVTIHDTKEATFYDLSSQYFLTEKSVGQNRAKESLSNLVELNDTVTVDCYTGDLSEHFIKKFDVSVLTSSSSVEQRDVSKWVRRANKKLIIADSRGLFGMIFNDFGKSHIIDDANGEQCLEVFIEHIDKNTGDVTCLPDHVHGLEDGNYVTFSEVKGMIQLNHSLPRKITVINKTKFNIGDIGFFPDYIEGGIARQVKVPFSVSYKCLNDSIEEPEFVITDYAKPGRSEQMHILWAALLDFEFKFNRVPWPFDSDDAEELLNIARDINDDTKSSVEKLDEELCKKFSFGARGNISPVCGFIGGVAAQEAMKAVSGLFTPIKQWMYFDALECLPDSDSPYCKLNAETCESRNSRYDGQAAVFGWNFQKALEQQKWFLVGAGAIGCELLKYFSLMGIGCGRGGIVKVTDMDQIEISNLNRQFLFRRHDVGSKKSLVAARAAKAFNPNMNVESLCDRVGSETENFFNDNFFQSLNGVCNALDNVDARRYVDRRCVYYRLPLLETGTMGPKGNAQVIYPFLTESYSSSSDPPEKSIPICTVKHFPSQIEHSIQWAREMFEGMFSNPADSANQFLQNRKLFFERLEKMHMGQKVEMLLSVKKVLLDDRPTSPEHCIEWARQLFEKHFNFEICQLLHNFPLNQLTTHGTKFWSGTKRCPHPLKFDAENNLHMEFVSSASILRAQMYNITPITDLKNIGQIASFVKISEFQPQSGVKIPTSEAEAQQQMSADADHEQPKFYLQQSSIQQDENQVTELKLILNNLQLDKKVQLNVIDFEKDDDSNHHVEFITATSNLRAENYDIPKASNLKTKQIAGRIIPAIATSTAAVAGLDCIELYKIVIGAGKCKLGTFKNGFFNLALPYVGFAEPIACQKKKFNNTEWTLWDRLEIDGEMTMKEMFDYIKNKHQLDITMLSHGVSMVYSFFMDPSKIKERMKLPVTKVIENVCNKQIPNYSKALILEPICTDAEGKDVDVPYINYCLRK